MATKPKPVTPVEPSNKALRIVAKREGFRRAGRAFGSEAITVPLDELTDDQVEQITTETMLVVTEVDIEPAAEAAAAPAAT